MIDSLLATVDRPTRRQVAAVCDYLGGKTGTRPREAALFVGRQVQVWAKGKEYAWMGGSERAVAEWALGAAERQELEGMYRHHAIEMPRDPIQQMYAALRAAKDGHITWEEARERVDSLIGAYPENGDAQRLGLRIRDVTLPQWRAKGFLRSTTGDGDAGWR